MSIIFLMMKLQQFTGDNEILLLRGLNLSLHVMSGWHKLAVDAAVCTEHT